MNCGEEKNLPIPHDGINSLTAYRVLRAVKFFNMVKEE